MNRFRYLLICLAILAGSYAPLLAVDFDPLAASIEENILQPPVPAKIRSALTAAMAQLVNALRDAGYTTATVRDGQVAVVTIQASELFAPGETSIKESAASRLRPLMPYIRRSDNYKIIVAAHSDNTGDELYNDRLTADRANAVDEFFYTLNGNADTGIIPYGLGYDEPVESNNSVNGRAANRRIEIYFVPTAEYMDKIKRHR